ncbi:transposase [Actinoplanes couchii]|uniref:transposase n=1 Tax=Actinoplanes couchii TaxID=403638 RepID=UPI0019429D8C
MRSCADRICVRTRSSSRRWCPGVAAAGHADTERESIEHLSAAVETAFQQHPDHDVITSFPGIAAQAGARLLGEIGDDRNRLADARSLKAFAGEVPVTRACGRSLVSQRRIKNDRLAAVGFTWDCRHLTSHPVRWPTTIGAGPPETVTPLPSAASSAACKHGSPIEKRQPSRSRPPSRLDRHAYRTSCRLTSSPSHRSRRR